MGSAKQPNTTPNISNNLLNPTEVINNMVELRIQ